MLHFHFLREETKVSIMIVQYFYLVFSKVRYFSLCDAASVLQFY